MHRSLFVAGLYLPEKMNDAWKEGLEKNTASRSADLEDQFDTLCEYQADMDKGDQMIYTYVPGKGTEVEIKGKVKGMIEGEAFADALFACWIGANPPGEDFKNGLLGK